MEMYESSSRAVVEMMRSFMASPTGIFLYATVTGVVGILVLLIFLSLFVAPNDLVIFLPFIAAFNGAASGFSITGKEASFTHRKTAFLVITALLTVTGCFLLTLFCPWELFVDVDRLFTTGAFTLIATWFGGWIGQKNKSYKKQ